MLNRVDLHHIVNLRQLLFVKSMIFFNGHNMVVSSIMGCYVHGIECKTVFDKVNSNLSWSCNKVKAMMFVCFANCFNVCDS